MIPGGMAIRMGLEMLMTAGLILLTAASAGFGVRFLIALSGETRRYWISYLVRMDSHAFSEAETDLVDRAA